MGLENIDVKYVHVVLGWVRSNTVNKSDDFDFQKPYIRTALRHLYPLYIFLYACVFVFGTIGNICILWNILQRRLYKNPMYVFIGNIALSDLFKTVIVLPLTLANLLIQNWMFGSLLCYLLPMMHFFPVHASILTYLMIAVDRYRLIVYPIKSRVPAGLCVIAVWVLAICAVLPYAVYVEYIDLDKILGDRFAGIGLCLLNIEHNAQQYIRAIFVIAYCLPLGIIASLFIKVSTEIKYSLTDSAPIRIDYSRSPTPEGSSSAAMIGQDDSANSTPHRKTQYSYYDDDDDINVAKETGIQNRLITMVVLFAACWLPVNILTIVTHFVYETSDNSDHYDTTYTTLSFIAFLSTCVNPVLFVSLRLQPYTRERIREYLSFTRANATVVENGSCRANPSPNPTVMSDLPSPNANKVDNGKNTSDRATFWGTLSPSTNNVYSSKC